MVRVAFNAHESVTVGTSATGLTAATYGLNDYATILVENANVRFWMDGTSPTSTVGDLLYPGDRVILEGNNEIKLAKFISTSSSSATLRVNYGLVV